MKIHQLTTCVIAIGAMSIATLGFSGSPETAASEASLFIGDAASEGRLVTKGIGIRADTLPLLTYFQHTGSPTIYTAPTDQNLTLKEVNFFADTSGTLTPFVARYLGGDTQAASNYKILSIGDALTVTSSDDLLGPSAGDHLENRAFTVSSVNPTISVNTGDMIVAGWLQDGCIVIVDGTAQGVADYVANGDTLSGATVGGAPTGNSDYAFDRTMRFNIGFDISNNIGSIPVVTISSPAADSVFEEGVSVSFVATVTDVEDADATLEAALIWASDLEPEPIGTGASFSTDSLSEGTHTITAYSTDSDLNVGSDAIIITIGVKHLGAIWFIGDSITQSNADGDANGSPRKSLYDLLVANDYVFNYTGHFTANVDGLPTTGATPADNLYHYHSGISGSVIGDGVSGRWGMTESLSYFWNNGRLAVVKPDIILIMLGANDVDVQIDLPGAPGRLQTLVENIYELPDVGNPTIFLAQITPNRTSEPQDPINVAAFNAAIPDVVSGFIAQGRDVRLVDHFTPINDDYATTMQSDNLHPNAAGNDVMALQWYNAITGTFPGTPSDFYSFDLYSFVMDGLSCKVVVPDVVAEGRHWIWRARFWGHEPGPDIALLNNGFHVVYVDVVNLFGSPDAVARFDTFYDFLTQSYGLDQRVVLEGMSRGGLIIYNWAAQNADKVHCIYADAPVCDFKSWPGGFGTGSGSPSDWITCKAAYGFTSDAEALAYGGNPVDNMQPLAAAGIPLLHVVGDADTVVPVSENTAIVEANHISFGGAIKVIHKPGVGHVHGLDDPSPIIDFIMNVVFAKDHIPMFLPGATFSNGNVNVQFSGTTGQHYCVESVDDLTTTNAWQVVTNVVSLETSPMDVSAPTTNSAGFFRIGWFPW